jgi:hypothetical protein
LDQPVRKAIIQILSEGREITDADGEKRIIRVLNASQLLERINEMAEEKGKHGLEPIKRSNLYYHINALVEKNFISEVGLIPKKNRLISYYGRTARVFLLEYGDEKQPEFLDDPNFLSLVSNINPDVDAKTASEIVKGLELMYQQVDTGPINKWVEANETVLRESEVDIRVLHNIFYKILAFNDETIAALRKFAEVMKLNID